MKAFFLLSHKFLNIHSISNSSSVTPGGKSNNVQGAKHSNA